MAFDTTSIYDQANTRITGWGNQRMPELVAEMGSLGIKHRKGSPSKKPATKSLRNNFSKSRGLISRIGYSIPRHMVYVHKGVGRGTTIAQVGTNKRVAKPWFNPIIEKHMDELADIVAEEMGSAIINNLFIR